MGCVPNCTAEPVTRRGSTASCVSDTGPHPPALRWGEPAYLTSKSRSGSTIRLGWKDSEPGTIALHFICNTNLVERFRNWYPKALQFEGNRSIVLRLNEPLPEEPLRDCIAAALTYHLEKRKRPRTVR